MKKNGEKKPRIGEEVSFKYTYAEQFKVLYANGVWGGPNAHGDIVMNFFIERQKPPEETTHIILPEGKLDEKSRTPKKDLLIREFQTSVILNLSIAKSVREWLNDKIEVLENAIKNKPEGGNGK